MIETLYGAGELVTSPSAKTFVAALVIGLGFGFVLERAGFGSSRRLAGIFYFRDMTVLKVMFSAMLTAMLGVLYLSYAGILNLSEQVYLLPTQYGAQAIGGLIFGLGFVLSGWCPGTAAVGMASGKIDALVFLGGSVIGSILYNETYGLTESIRNWGSFEQPLFAFGLARPVLALGIALAAVAAFYFAEWAERLSRSGTETDGPRAVRPAFLRGFSVALVALAAVLLMLPGGAQMAQAGAEMAGASDVQSADEAQLERERQLLAAVDAAADHIEPEDLAARLLRGERNLVVVDVRPAAEFEQFHIRGAINLPLERLPEALAAHKNEGLIVLYSNGMTHPAQARDALARLGFENVYLLTDGLRGFMERVLMPVSLRDAPLSGDAAAEVAAFRSYFLPATAAAAAVMYGNPRGGNSAFVTEVSAPAAVKDRAAGENAAGDGVSGLVSSQWLAKNLGREELKLIDVRAQPAYNTSHIPGSISLHPESLRGVVDGVPSSLLPAEMLAQHMSLMGIRPGDTVIIVPGDAVRDATLVGMALDRLGHKSWAILDGGFEKWIAEQHPTDNQLPRIATSKYPVPDGTDTFTLAAADVVKRMNDGKTTILDARPADFFRGEKSDEARAGHIPGAVNRAYSDDLAEDKQLKSLDELKAAYADILPPTDSPVVVHCRTGHQASQTYFVLKHLLKRPNVLWYDGSWTDWATRLELPVEKAPAGDSDAPAEQKDSPGK